MFATAAAVKSGCVCSASANLAQRKQLAEHRIAAVGLLFSLFSCIFLGLLYVAVSMSTLSFFLILSPGGCSAFGSVSGWYSPRSSFFSLLPLPFPSPFPTLVFALCLPRISICLSLPSLSIFLFLFPVKRSFEAQRNLLSRAGALFLSFSLELSLALFLSLSFSRSLYLALFLSLSLPGPLARSSSLFMYLYTSRCFQQTKPLFLSLSHFSLRVPTVPAPSAVTTFTTS